jgi:hypothetical protein
MRTKTDLLHVWAFYCVKKLVARNRNTAKELVMIINKIFIVIFIFSNLFSQGVIINPAHYLKIGPTYKDLDLNICFGNFPPKDLKKYALTCNEIEKTINKNYGLNTERNYDDPFDNSLQIEISKYDKKVIIQKKYMRTISVSANKKSFSQVAIVESDISGMIDFDDIEEVKKQLYSIIFSFMNRYIEANKDY